MRLRLSAFTPDPRLIAEFQNNLPALEKFLRANGMDITLRIDTIENDGGAPVVLNPANSPSRRLDPKMIEDLRKRYDRR